MLNDAAADPDAWRRTLRDVLLRCRHLPVRWCHLGRLGADVTEREDGGAVVVDDQHTQPGELAGG